MIGELTKTPSGFQRRSFEDFDGHKCSIQQSSIALYEQPGTSALRIGIDDPEPRILASQASRCGVSTDETTGWVPYPVPADVLMSPRMHLSRDQVAELVPVLVAWLDTGRLGESDE